MQGHIPKAALFLAIALLIAGCSKASPTAAEPGPELLQLKIRLLELAAERDQLKGEIGALTNPGKRTVTEEQAVSNALKINPGAAVKAARLIEFQKGRLPVSVWVVDIRLVDRNWEGTVIIDAVTGQPISADQPPFEK